MDIYVNPGNLSFTEAVNSQIFWIYRKRGMGCFGRMGIVW